MTSCKAYTKYDPTVHTPSHKPGILLWEPTKPGNYGAILRVNAAMGVDEMFSFSPERQPGGPNATPMPFSSKWRGHAVRIARRSERARLVKQFRVTDEEALEHLLGQFSTVIATAPPGEDAVSASTFEYPDNALYMFGTELDGLPESLIERADVRLTIPMVGDHCLNLASAYSMVMFAYRQQHPLDL